MFGDDGFCKVPGQNEYIIGLVHVDRLRMHHGNMQPRREETLLKRVVVYDVVDRFLGHAEVVH